MRHTTLVWLALILFHLGYAGLVQGQSSSVSPAPEQLQSRAALQEQNSGQTMENLRSALSQLLQRVPGKGTVGAQSEEILEEDLRARERRIQRQILDENLLSTRMRLVIMESVERLSEDKLKQFSRTLKQTPRIGPAQEASTTGQASNLEQVEKEIQAEQQRLNAIYDRFAKMVTQYDKASELVRLSNVLEEEAALAPGYYDAEQLLLSMRAELIQSGSQAQRDRMATAEYNLALDLYQIGDYASAQILLASLVVAYPDFRAIGKANLYLGESYRFLRKFDKAQLAYQNAVEASGLETELRAVALFQLEAINFDFKQRDRVISYYQRMVTEFSTTRIFPECAFLAGQIYFQLGDFEQAIQAFSNVPRRSGLFGWAQHWLSQCYISQGQLADAEMPLKNVVELGSSSDKALQQLIWESSTKLGHLYFELGQYSKAMKAYKQTPPSAHSYDQALLGIAAIEFRNGNFDLVIGRLKELIIARPSSNQIYEAWVTMGNTYAHLKDYDEALSSFQYASLARRTRELISQNVAEQRKLVGLKEQLAELEKTAFNKGSRELVLRIRSQSSQIDITRAAANAMGEKLQRADPAAGKVIHAEATEAELASLSDQIEWERTRLSALQSQLQELEAIVRRRKQVYLMPSIQRTARNLDYLEVNLLEVGEVAQMPPLRVNTNTYEHWLEEAEFGIANIGFVRYRDYREQIEKQFQALMQVRERLQKGYEDWVSVPPELAQEVEVLETNNKKLEKELSAQRPEVMANLDAFLKTHPNSRYAPDVLFRLADVAYDEANESFQKDQDEYYRRLEQSELGMTTGKLGEPPKPHYEKSIELYQKLIHKSPDSPWVDDALFQLGYLLAVQGESEEATETFEELVSRFPTSEFVPEAYMRIGEYYFERGGDDLQKAIEAYKRILPYWDSPRFPVALYKLGWTNYRNNQFYSAINDFIALLEDSLAVANYYQVAEAAQVTPKLLAERFSLASEAIRYIAISFSENAPHQVFQRGGKDQEAEESWRSVPGEVKNFVLETVGRDKPYAVSIMRALGEVYTERGINEAAIVAYNNLLEVFPTYRDAPQIQWQVVEQYAALKRGAEGESAAQAAQYEQQEFAARERLFKEFGRAWAEAIDDTAAQRQALELAERSGWEASNYYALKAGEANDDPVLYGHAAEMLEAFLEDFPESAHGYDARWNLAVILDKYLQRYEEAWMQYLKVSQLEQDKYREQAAINAIAVAQELVKREAAQASSGAPPNP